MKQIRLQKLLIPVAVLAVAGCSHPAKKAEAPKVEKVAEEAVVHVPQTHLRPVRETQLENGLKIIFINDNSLPRVSLALLAKVGSFEDPAGKEGLNFMTARLLEQGTQSKSATVIADELGQLGTEISIEPNSDFTMITMDSLANSTDKLLALFSEIVLNPAFTDGELSRMRAQVLAEIQKRVDDPSSYASEKFETFLYGPHPYASDIMGEAKTIRKISKQDVIRHYLNNYRPNNAMLAVVGRYSKDFEAKVSEAFSKWHGKPIREQKFPELKDWKGIETLVLTKPGLQQTQIRIGELGIRRSDPDFLKLRLANVALGGEFASRLNQHVRAELGLTYSISSAFDSRLDRGPFMIDTFTKNETVGKTVDESLKVYDEFVAKGMTEEELKAAKQQLVSQFPRAIETVDRYAYNILALTFYGIPLSYLHDFSKNVEAITLPEVNAAIQSHLSTENLRILIYTDQKKLGDQLKAYKPTVQKAL